MFVDGLESGNVDAVATALWLRDELGPDVRVVREERDGEHGSLFIPLNDRGRAKLEQLGFGGG